MSGQISLAKHLHQLAKVCKHYLTNLFPQFVMNILAIQKNEAQAIVTIDWKDRIRRNVLPPELSSFGKMFCRGTKKQIARAAWQCLAIRSESFAEIVKEIHKESVMMCVKEK